MNRPAIYAVVSTYLSEIFVRMVEKSGESQSIRQRKTSYSSGGLSLGLSPLSVSLVIGEQVVR
jgi:hypothetical protein